MNSDPIANSDWLQLALPIVRIREFRRFLLGPRRKEIVAIYENGIICGQVKTDTLVAESAYAADGDEALLSLCQASGWGKRVPFNEVKRLTTYQRCLIVETDKIVIQTKADTFKHRIASREMGNVCRAFSMKLGDSYRDVQRTSILRLFLSLTPCFAVSAAAYSHGLDGPFTAALLILVVATLLTGVSVSILGQRVPRAKPKKKVTQDLSGKNAIRFRIAGKLLAFVGALFVVYWLGSHVFFTVTSAFAAGLPTRVTAYASSAFALFVVPCLAFSRFGRMAITIGILSFVFNFGLGVMALAASPTIDIFYGLLLVIAPYLGLLSVQIGRSLQVRTVECEVENDTRSPILYLRAFDDDIQDTLTPNRLLATIFGLKMSDAVWRLPAWQKVIFEIHPYRLLRSLAGQTPQTTEMQLADYFRQHGPFVAIGEPGEWFSPQGASRMYIGNDAWQQKVIDLMDRSQFVVLQAARSEGFFWEVQTSLERVPPEKLLFCLSNFRDRQNEYEDFRIRVESVSGWKFPRSVGNQSEPQFLYFDENQTPLTHEISYLSPLKWAFRGAVSDLEHTLKKFVDRRLDGDYAPNGFPWHGSLAALMFLTLVPTIWGLLLYAATMVVQLFVGQPAVSDFPI